MSIILLLSMGFMACKKDSTTQPKTTQEKLLGKWNYVSTVSNQFYSGSSHIITNTGAAGDYADFRNDGKVYFYTNGSRDTTVYGIVNESKVWVDNTSNVFDLKVITETDLEFYNKEILNVSDYNETTTRFKK